MAQTVTGISKKKKKKSCGILQTSQPCLLSVKKGLYSVWDLALDFLWYSLFFSCSWAPVPALVLQPYLCPDGSSAVVRLSPTLWPPANFDLISFDLVTIHSEFTVMLFIPSCSKQMPSAQAITSSCGKFASLESRDLHAGVVLTLKLMAPFVNYNTPPLEECFYSASWLLSFNRDLFPALFFIWGMGILFPPSPQKVGFGQVKISSGEVSDIFCSDLSHESPTFPAVAISCFGS